MSFFPSHRAFFDTFADSSTTISSHIDSSKHATSASEEADFRLLLKLMTVMYNKINIAETYSENIILVVVKFLAQHVVAAYV